MSDHAGSRGGHATPTGAALFSAVFDASPLGINIFRLSDGRTLEVNDAYCRLIGWRREEIVGHTAEELRLFVEPAQREPWLKILAGGGDVLAQLATIRTKSGTTREVLASLKCVPNEGDTLAMVIASDVTEQRRAEATRREQEARFRYFFEAAHVGKSISLPTGELSVNEAFARMLGYARTDLEQKRWQAITPPEDVPMLEAILEELRRGTRDQARLTKRYLHRDGSFVWADVSTVLQRDPAGAPLCFYTTVVDVTERKRAEDALRLSEERFAKAFKVSPAGMTITDIATGTFLDVNDAFLQMFGWRRDEVVGHTSLEVRLLTPEERQHLIAQQLATGGLQAAELRARARGGNVVDILFSSRPLTIDGRACHVTTMIDISSRKAAEEALRQSEERYRRLTENLPDLVWRTDAAGRVDFVNRAVTQLLGYAADEVQGRALADYLAPSSAATLQGWLGGGATWAPVLAELHYIHKDGHLVPGEVHAVPVLGKEGQLVAVEGVTRDLRPRQQAEREHAELQEQLHQAQRLESIGRLAGGVAHDFNNLLSVILGFTGFALQPLREEDPVRADLLEVQGAANRAATLTRQLLAFSRRQVLEPQVVDVNEVVTAIDKMLRRIVGEDVTVELHLGEKLGSVLADPGQLEQVVMNLVVNARDAMPHGGRLVIATNEVERAPPGAINGAPARWVALSVTDTGTGMDAETRRRVFEPFFTTKEKGRGTGLGLSTVYGIVQQSGGFLEVDTELGRGSTFTVLLPRTEAPPATASPAEVAGSRGYERVLLVEDEEAVRRLAVRMLQSAGYDVTAAASGTEALSFCDARHGSFDLLITDVVMPKMSGAELVARCRQVSPTMKVLFMSGYTDDQLTPHEVQPSQLLVKPFSAAELRRRVRDVLDAT